VIDLGGLCWVCGPLVVVLCVALSLLIMVHGVVGRCFIIGVLGLWRGVCRV
jgi:hypothetical protein